MLQIPDSIRRLVAAANEREESLPRLKSPAPLKRAKRTPLAPLLLSVLLLSSVFPTLGEATASSLLSSSPATTHSSFTANFIGNSIAAGNYIWFDEVLKPVSSVPLTGLTVYLVHQTITSGSFQVSVPDAILVFSPGAASATTRFDASLGAWVTKVPANFKDYIFLAGLAYLVPAGGLPSSSAQVTWSGDFSGTAATAIRSFSIQAQWAAGVYTQFSAGSSFSYSSLGVKPVHSTTLDSYHNSDQAGTPENFKSFLLWGVTGSAGSVSLTVTQQTIRWSQPWVTLQAREALPLHLSFVSAQSLSGASVVASPSLTGLLRLSSAGFSLISAGTNYSLTITVTIPLSTPSRWYNGTVSIRVGANSIPSSLVLNVFIPLRTLVTLDTPHGSFTDAVVKGSSPYFSNAYDLIEYAKLQNGTSRPFRTIYDALANFALVDPATPVSAHEIVTVQNGTNYLVTYHYTDTPSSNYKPDLATATAALKANQSNPLIVRVEIRWADVGAGPAYDFSEVDRVFTQVLQQNSQAYVTLATETPPPLLDQWINNVQADYFVGNVTNYIAMRGWMTRVAAWQVSSEPNLHPPFVKVGLVSTVDYPTMATDLATFATTVRRNDPSNRPIVVNMYQAATSPLLSQTPTADLPWYNTLSANLVNGQQLASAINVMGVDLYPDQWGVSNATLGLVLSLQNSTQEFQWAQLHVGFTGRWGIIEMPAGPRFDALGTQLVQPSEVSRWINISRTTAPRPSMIGLSELRGCGLSSIASRAICVVDSVTGYYNSYGLIDDSTDSSRQPYGTVVHLAVHPNSPSLPSSVGTTTTMGGLPDRVLRQSAFVNNRILEFFSDGTNIVYSTSFTGGTWTAPIVVRPGQNAGGLSIWFDGTYIYYVFADAVVGDPVVFRRGVLNADGSMSWSAPEQVVVPGSSVSYAYASVATDTSGYPYIGYREIGVDRILVTSSSTADGTWVTANGFPFQPDTVSPFSHRVSIVPLTNGKVAVVWASDSLQVGARYWSGSSWSPCCAFTASTTIHAFFSAVAQGDNIHVAYLDPLTSGNVTIDANVAYAKYISSTNSFNAPSILQSNLGTDAAPTITLNQAKGDIYIFWTGYPTVGHLFYSHFTASSGTWSASPADWTNESSHIALNNPTGFYQAYGSSIGVAYLVGTSGAFTVRLDYLGV